MFMFDTQYWQWGTISNDGKLEEKLKILLGNPNALN